MSYPARGRGPASSSQTTNRVNHFIKAGMVRLIDTDGSQLGIKPLPEALAIARSKGLDLVEVAPKANPPVCKVLDFSKFKYEQDKKHKEARKNQKGGLLKEVRISPVIGIHDLEVKIKHAEEFLRANDKVRITVLFRGRQMQHQDIGKRLLQDVQNRLSSLSSVEQPPATDKNRMSMTLAPKR